MQITASLQPLGEINISSLFRGTYPALVADHPKVFSQTLCRICHNYASEDYLIKGSCNDNFSAS